MSTVPRVGQRLAGRYRLMRTLGRGGLGIVFLARDARRAEAGHTDPYVALKLLREDLRHDATARGLFCRQALRACRIASPHVVRVHDLDRDGDDCFMSMEYIRGIDLRRAMQGGVSRDHALAWIQSLGRALIDLHRAGWVHADLKPANVMIDARGPLRLLDVGLVEDISGGVPVLTPAYASRARRDGAGPSVHDDVYAFACMAYELLSGRRPFTGGEAGDGAALARVPELRGAAWRKLREALQCEPPQTPCLATLVRSFSRCH